MICMRNASGTCEHGLWLVMTWKDTSLQAFLALHAHHEFVGQLPAHFVVAISTSCTVLKETPQK
jgi:hypothetical protein